MSLSLAILSCSRPHNRRLTFLSRFLGSICDCCLLGSPNWVVRQRIRVKYGMEFTYCSGTCCEAHFMFPRFRLKMGAFSAYWLSCSMKIALSDFKSFRLPRYCFLRLLHCYPALQRDEGSRLSFVPLNSLPRQVPRFNIGLSEARYFQNKLRLFESQFPSIQFFPVGTAKRWELSRKLSEHATECFTEISAFQCSGLHYRHT